VDIALEPINLKQGSDPIGSSTFLWTGEYKTFEGFAKLHECWEVLLSAEAEMVICYNCTRLLRMLNECNYLKWQYKVKLSFYQPTKYN